MKSQQQKPTSMMFQELISETRKGTIKVPKFQREFVWDLGQTAQLLDSMIKGYPIGTFILWETAERMNYVKNIGNLATIPDTPEGSKIKYVLDGQQRITSLFAAHQGAKIQRIGEKKITDYKQIFVDLDKNFEDGEESIVTTTKPDGEYASLEDILRANSPGPIMASLMKRFQNSEKHQNKVLQYANAFNSYEFSIVTLRSDDIDAAIEVFTRINTSGQTLTLFEIMSAKTYDENQNFDMHERWKQHTEEFKSARFESISNTTILYILAAILSSTKECKRKTILGLDKQRIIDAWDGSINALKKSITHMQTNLGVPVSGLLPYDSLLVPFAYFYYNNRGGPNSLQRKLLEEFFWWASLSYRYSAAAESRLSQDIRRIDSILTGERPSYDTNIHMQSESDLIEKGFRASDSYCKAVLCLLAAETPLDFQHGGKVILDNSWLTRADSKNYHHFFPKKHLADKYPPGHAHTNSVVNITFVREDLNKGKINKRSPSDYIAEFEKDDSDMEVRLKTHLIDRNEDGIDSDDYDLFLKNRAQRIFNKLKSKVDDSDNS